MSQKYVPPQAIRKWERDIPGGELYQFIVFDNGTVCAAYGRYSHSSGASQCGWAEFERGQLNELVRSTMGESVLTEALAVIRAGAGSGTSNRA